jgi:polyisoprenoid-binding protein YceI
MNIIKMNILLSLRFVRTVVLLLTLSITLIGCQTTTQPQSPTDTIQSVAPTENTPSAPTQYRIQSSSMVHILVYRGGPLARLGHNHVISSTDVQGTVDFNPQLSQSKFLITLPVNTLIVDAAEARAQEGEDFSASVPDDAREGTRRNLLRAEVLDGEHFPTVSLQSTRIEGTPTAPLLTLQVTLKGIAREVIVPAQVNFAPNAFTANGEFTLKQTDFGITPFSIGMGALQVKDELKIRFRIDAIQVQP